MFIEHLDVLLSLTAYTHIWSVTYNVCRVALSWKCWCWCLWRGPRRSVFRGFCRYLCWRQDNDPRPEIVLNRPQGFAETSSTNAIGSCIRCLSNVELKAFFTGPYLVLLPSQYLMATPTPTDPQRQPYLSCRISGPWTMSRWNNWYLHHYTKVMLVPRISRNSKWSRTYGPA